MLSFDSKDFERKKIIQENDPDTGEIVETKTTVFYSPFGVGIKFKNEKDFRIACLETTQSLAKEFGLSQKRVFYDSQSLKEELFHRRAIPFCDRLIQQLQEYMELAHFSYVVLPPKEVPMVRVGGYRSPAYDMKCTTFLRNLQPMFSHIAAWAYFGKERLKESEIQLDSFRSRQTSAWDELLKIVQPKIFPHGDECNPYIMLADIMAYLTDAKLYSRKLKLLPESLQEIWTGYKFAVDVHYLTEETQPRYRWYCDEHIDVIPYLAHPLVFLMVDELEQLQPNPPSLAGEKESQETEEPALREEKRFKKLVRRMEPWYATIAYAYLKEGAAQLFDFHTDRTKVRDGDIIVYIGNKSKELAESFSHMNDIEVLSAKELRKRVNKEKIIP